DTTTTAPAVITGAGFVLQHADSPALLAPNHFPPFELDSALVITMAGGETGNVNGTTTAAAPQQTGPPVPQPSTFALLALGGAALAGWRRWRRKHPPTA